MQRPYPARLRLVPADVVPRLCPKCSAGGRSGSRHTQGVAVVWRPTAARAVLHDQEVTYSVVMPVTLADGPYTITEYYRRIGMALAAALQALDFPVQLARPQVRAAPTHAPASPACFAALSRYELSVAGKKMVGSAQKRAQRALLQHGSIPLWMDRQLLFQCLRVPPEHRAECVQAAYSTMGAVNEVVARPVSLTALHEALRQGFGATFGVELIDMPIAPEEWHLAQHLRATNTPQTPGISMAPQRGATRGVCRACNTSHVESRVCTALLQCLYDLCLVCSFTQSPRQSLVHRSLGELGHRAVRVSVQVPTHRLGYGVLNLAQ